MGGSLRAAAAIAAVATIIYALNGGQFRRSRSGDTDIATADRKDGLPPG